MAAQINIESGDQRFGPGELDRVLGLGVRGRDLNPPLLAATNQGALEGKTGKLAIRSGRAASNESIKPSRKLTARSRGEVTCSAAAITSRPRLNNVEVATNRGRLGRAGWCRAGLAALVD